MNQIDDGKSRPITATLGGSGSESNMIKEIREMEAKIKLSQIPDVPTLEEVKAGKRKIKTKAEMD